jgi:putative lipoic acid-binding regulatory protein
MANNTTFIEFPCEFPIKVVGKADLEFQGEVMGIFRQHVPSLSESSVQTNYSKENKYLSITVTIYAQNQAQLDAIYQDLSHSEYVLMVL